LNRIVTALKSQCLTSGNRLPDMVFDAVEMAADVFRSMGIRSGDKGDAQVDRLVQDRR